MNVSARVEYACLALMELGIRNAGRRPVPLRAIAEPHAIPAQFLAQILQSLKAAGLVQSARGPRGGYHLARSPQTISLWDVVRAVEGEMASPEQPAPTDPVGVVLARVWLSLASAQRELLRRTTIGKLCADVSAAAEPMYYI